MSSTTLGFRACLQLTDKWSLQNTLPLNIVWEIEWPAMHVQLNISACKWGITIIMQLSPFPFQFTRLHDLSARLFLHKIRPAIQTASLLALFFWGVKLIVLEVHKQASPESEPFRVSWPLLSHRQMTNIYVCFFLSETCSDFCKQDSHSLPELLPASYLSCIRNC